MICFYDKNGQEIYQGNVPTPRDYVFTIGLLQDVFAAYADGDELKLAFHILGEDSNKGTFRFVGDEAKTIAANW